MATGDRIIVPAQAAGFVSLFGEVRAVSAATLNLPGGMINVGGNGLGYLLAAQTGWDPYAAANNDGSFAALTLGDNIYLYAVQDASGTAKWLASKNATVPTGYTSSNSRKIGGFHVGRYRGAANRYDTAYIPTVQILPNSCWDLHHRPTCDPTGMVEVVPGSLWVDIYLNSEGSGTWPENIPVSRYGATPIRDNVYARTDFHQLAGNAGKRMPAVEEFLRYAEGAPAGLGGSNDQAWSATTNSGPTTAGGVVKAVSQYNVVDAVGNLYDWLDNHYDLGDFGGNVTSYTWDAAAGGAGKDAAFPRGSVDHYAWRSFLGGGHWNFGVYCGARCLASSAPPGIVSGIVGLRGVCDSL